MSLTSTFSNIETYVSDANTIAEKILTFNGLESLFDTSTKNQWRLRGFTNKSVTTPSLTDFSGNALWTKYYTDGSDEYAYNVSSYYLRL